MAREPTTLGAVLDELVAAFNGRYGPVANTEIRKPDGTWEVEEWPYDGRQITIDLGESTASEMPNGSVNQPVDQVVEITVQQALFASDDPEEDYRRWLNLVGDIIAFGRFLPVTGAAPMKYVRGGPVDIDLEEAKVIQWYLEFVIEEVWLGADQESLAPNERAQIFRAGQYTGPWPPTSLSAEYYDGSDTELPPPDSPQVILIPEPEDEPP